MEKIQEQIIEKIQLITFKMGEENYGSEITRVQEIIWLTAITRVPKAPRHIVGVINLRGQIIPIISLVRRLNLNSDVQQDEFSRIILFKARDLVAGIIVDAVSEVALDNVELPPEVQDGQETSYIQGVAKLAKKVVIILDVDKVIFGNLGDGGSANG